MISMYLTGMTALVAPRRKEASGGWNSTSAPTFSSRLAISPRVPLAMPTSTMTMATCMATASTETAVRVLRWVTFAAARLAIGAPDDNCRAFLPSNASRFAVCYHPAFARGRRAALCVFPEAGEVGA